MPRKPKKKPSEFDLVHASVPQIQELKKDVAELEHMLKEDKASGRNKITDEAEFKKVIDEKKQILADHSPRKLRGAKANRAYAKAKELQEEIKEAMPSGKAYFQPYPKGSDSHRRERDFEDAVNQQIAFQQNPRIKQAVREYKNILRRLDPNDPTVSNIEKLRR